MTREPYVQFTVKFPTGKERYRQAVELITDRDKGVYPRLADYLTTAILAFEGNLSDERTNLNLIMQEILKISEKLEEISDEQKKGKA